MGKGTVCVSQEHEAPAQVRSNMLMPGSKHYLIAFDRS